ncbi:MAG TPA: DUF2249 domain-containing protein, partial [Thermaerobacter sp.]
HSQMVKDLEHRVNALIDAVRQGRPHADAAQAVVEYAEKEILPHARAEEETLYAAGANKPEARVLVESLTAEHEAIGRAIEDLRGTRDGVEAVASASALAALFKAHAARENEALLPVLVADGNVDLGQLLAGMHERLMGRAQEATDASAAAGEEQILDVRALPPFQRHSLIFETFESLDPGGAFILVNDHDPKPLYYQFAAERPNQFTWEYLEQGPEVWRVRIGRR